MPYGYECQEGLGVTPGDPPDLLCTSQAPLVASTPHWGQTQLCHLGGLFDWAFLQGGKLRWASPGHEIWVVWLARAGHIPHPDLPYQSYGIWWTCGHHLVVVGGEKNSQKVILEVWAICKWVAFRPIQEPWRLVNSSGDLSSRRFGLWWSKVLSRSPISGCFLHVKRGALTT